MDGAVGRHHPRLTPAPPLPIAVCRTRMRTRTSSAFKLPSVYLTIYLSMRNMCGGAIWKHLRRLRFPTNESTNRSDRCRRKLSHSVLICRYLGWSAGKICSVGKMTAILWKRPPRPLTIKAYQFQAKVWLNIGKSCKTVMLTASYRGLRT